MSAIENNLYYPSLLAHARLIRMQDCSALINRLSGNYVLLQPLSAAIIAMCNGSLSLEKITQICAESLFKNFQEAKESVHQVLNKCAAFVAISTTQNINEWRYHAPDFLNKPRVKTDSLMYPLEKPLQMTLVLTNRCNFNCVYCFRDSGYEWNKELTKDEIFAIIDQAAEMELKYCSLTGGEPSLHPHFEDIVIRLLEKDIYPYISSNGTCLKEATLSKLKKAGLQTIQFSMDSGIPALFDRMVGNKGYFDKVVNTIKTAKRLGYIVRIKGVVTNLNALNISSLFDVCANCGVDFVHVEAFSPGLEGRGNKELLLTHDMALKVEADIDQAIVKYSGKMMIAPFTVPVKWSDPEDIIYCGGMYTSFIVQPDGTVCACEQVSHDSLNFGNIRAQSLSTIWNSKKVLQFLNPNKDNVKEPCKSCEEFDRCRSGCFNYSLLYSNELYSPDPRCWKVKLGEYDPLKLEA